MRNLLKKIIKNLINYKIFRYPAELISEVLWRKKITLNYKGIELKFVAPNYINRWRIRGFSTEEPETLEWIDSFEKNNPIFWDIGANVGLYTCYAAKKKNCQVYAFEPSVFNLQLLATNIWENGIADKVIIFPLPLSDKNQENKFYMSSTESGGANSTFGENIDFQGKKMKNTFEYATIGITIEHVVNFFKVKKPNYIKIDVDGIEHLIIKGGLASIKNAESILVEVDEKFKERSDQVENFLLESGFVLESKKQPDNVRSTKYESTFNQIWRKSNKK